MAAAARTPLEKIAVVVAARTHFMARQIEADDWIVYERVLDDADAELGGFTARHGLESYPFARHLDRDYSVSGRAFERADVWRDRFDADERAMLDAVFGELEGRPMRRQSAGPT